MKSKVIAKAVVLNIADQVLLLRRSQTDTRRPGEWDFPGGGIEEDEGEDMTAGVACEITEEAGLNVPVTDLRLVYAATELYDDNSVTRLLYAGRVGDSQVTLSFEHDDFKWVDIDTALEEFPHPFYGTGLKYARAHGLLP